MTSIFKLTQPTVSSLPVLANLPHSDLFVPEAIRRQFTASHQAFLPNQDWHLDQLYDFLPRLGVTMLQATHSRYVVDLNRALKPPYFGNFWSVVVAEKTAFNQPLYEILSSPKDVEQRLEDYYRPAIPLIGARDRQRRHHVLSASSRSKIRCKAAFRIGRSN